MRRDIVFTLLSLLLVAGGTALLVVVPRGGLPFYVAEGVLAGCIALLWIFRTRLIKPLNTIANGMDLLREQDFSSRLSPVGQPDADRIVEMFNSMMSRLKEERLHVREQNHFLDLLIAASPMGIVMLDGDGEVSMANEAAMRFLEITSGDVAARCRLGELPGALAEQLASMPQGAVETVRLSDSMIYRCSRLSFMDMGFAHPFIMIEKLTDEVMKAEKKAYEKVIRMMAHEVNNSMAGVNSLLDTVASTVDDPDMAEALDVCVRRCDTMSRFVTSFADVVKIPQAVKRACDLNRFIADTLPLLESLCCNRGIRLRFIPSCGESEVSLDKVLMEQVLINLVKNSAESIGSDGDITISVDDDGRGFVIADNGAGIDRETQPKIFTPFFTSKADGHGLGLLFVSDVLHKHRCVFSLRTGDDGLTRFAVRFS